MLESGRNIPSSYVEKEIDVTCLVAHAKKMIDAGATRLGASAGIRILQESKSVTYSN